MNHGLAKSFLCILCIFLRLCLWVCMYMCVRARARVCVCLWLLQGEWVNVGVGLYECRLRLSAPSMYIFCNSILDIFLLTQTAFIFHTLKPYHTNDDCICQNGLSDRCCQSSKTANLNSVTDSHTPASQPTSTRHIAVLFSHVLGYSSVPFPTNIRWKLLVFQLHVKASTVQLKCPPPLCMRNSFHLKKLIMRH